MQDYIVCQAEWATLVEASGQSKNALGGQGRQGRWAKEGWGALGGHYTDGSPEPLTNLDLALPPSNHHHL